MKANTLLNTLSRISTLAQGNRIVPITSTFKMSFIDNKMTASATDLQTFATVIDYCEELQGETFCVDASQFINILKGFGDNEIQLLHEDNTLTVKSGRSKYKIPTQSAVDFPKKTEQSESSKNVDANTIKEPIDNCIFAVSRDELRPSMMGIYFNSNDVVSTDAHKLVKYNINNDIGEFIIPSQSARFISSFIYGDVNVYFNGTQLNIKGDDFEVSTLTIDERYPDYNSVIPTEFESSFSVDRKMFIDAVQRLILTANKQTNAIALNLGDNCFAYSADTDFNTEGSEQLDGSYIGEPMSIAFNGNFLLTSLKTIQEDIITLKLISPNKASVIECENKLILIMPVRL